MKTSWFIAKGRNEKNRENREKQQSWRNKNVRILWVSRHMPLPAQLKALKDKLNSFEIIFLTKNIPNAEYVIQKALKEKVDIIIPVLPLSMIARIVDLAKKNNITVLYAEMKAVKTLDSTRFSEKDYDHNWETPIATREGTVRIMRFNAFKKIKEVKVILEDW